MATTPSYFGQLFLDLCDHIKAQVPEIKWIDQDFGQLEQFEHRPAVSFPCCLIDFVLANYSNLSELGQAGDVTIQLRLGFAPFSQSNGSAPDSVRIKAVHYYAIEQKVFEAVHGWATEYTQPLIRINAGTEQRLSANDAMDKIGLRVRVLNFSTQFEDMSNYPVFEKHAATFEADLDIVLGEEEEEENP